MLLSDKVDFDVGVEVAWWARWANDRPDWAVTLAISSFSSIPDIIASLLIIFKKLIKFWNVFVNLCSSHKKKFSVDFWCWWWWWWWLIVGTVWTLKTYCKFGTSSKLEHIYILTWQDLVFFELYFLTEQYHTKPPGIFCFQQKKNCILYSYLF